MVYISTSRKPSALTRRVARMLALVLGGEMENRGKRSLEDCVQRAHAAGFESLLFIYEKHGNPSRISFYNEKWLEPDFFVKGTALTAEKRVPAEAEFIAEDEKGTAFLEHALVQSVEGARFQVRVSAKGIFTFLDGKPFGFAVLFGH